MSSGRSTKMKLQWKSDKISSTIFLSFKITGWKWKVNFSTPWSHITFCNPNFVITWLSGRNLSALSNHPHWWTYRPERKESKEHAGPSTRRSLQICMRRCRRTLKLKNVLEEELKKQGVEHLFYEIEMPLVRVLANLEVTGCALIPKRWNKPPNISLSACKR